MQAFLLGSLVVGINGTLGSVKASPAPGVEAMMVTVAESRLGYTACCAQKSTTKRSRKKISPWEGRGETAVDALMSAIDRYRRVGTGHCKREIVASPVDPAP